MEMMSTHAAIPSLDGFLDLNQSTNTVSEAKALPSNMTSVFLDCSVKMSIIAWCSHTIVKSKLKVRGMAFPPMLTVPIGVFVLIVTANEASLCILGGNGGWLSWSAGTPVPPLKRSLT